MEEESKGLGDSIKKITHFFGIEPCPACEERAQRLNQLFPYSKETPTMDHVTRVNTLLSQPATQSSCKELSRLGALLGGYSIDSCFCTTTQRAYFVQDFTSWWQGVNQEDLLDGPATK